jgi:hypothetical protein
MIFWSFNFTWKAALALVLENYKSFANPSKPNSSCITTRYLLLALSNLWLIRWSVWQVCCRKRVHNIFSCDPNLPSVHTPGVTTRSCSSTLQVGPQFEGLDPQLHRILIFTLKSSVTHVSRTQMYTTSHTHQIRTYSY